MEIIKKISVCEDVALITVRNSPVDMNFIAEIFKMVADQGINVDMISQTAPISDRVDVSFTISEKYLDKMFLLFKAFRQKYPKIKYDVSTGNCKMSFYGEPMRSIPGVASDVFETISELNVDIRIITTSELDISILIPKENFTQASEVFEKKYGIPMSVE